MGLGQFFSRDKRKNRKSTEDVKIRFPSGRPRRVIANITNRWVISIKFRRERMEVAKGPRRNIYGDVL